MEYQTAQGSMILRKSLIETTIWQFWPAAYLNRNICIFLLEYKTCHIIRIEKMINTCMIMRISFIPPDVPLLNLYFTAHKDWQLFCKYLFLLPQKFSLKIVACPKVIDLSLTNLRLLYLSLELEMFMNL